MKTSRKQKSSAKLRAGNVQTVVVQSESVRNVKPGNIFDAFAKSTLGRVMVFADLLKNYADPQFVAQVDLSRIELVQTHFFGKENDERIVDLVFKCPLKNGNGKRLAVIIFEHQTNSLRDIPRKLHKYISAIWDTEKKAKQPFSAPYFMVLRTGKRPHKKPYPQMADLLPKDERGKPIGNVPEIVYDVIDLPAYDFDKLIGLPQLRLVLGLLKNMSAGLLDDFHVPLLPLREFANPEEQTEWFKEVIAFIAKVFAAHNQKLAAEQVTEAAKKVLPERSKNMIPTIFEEVEMRGIARGRTEGRTEGIVLGEARGQVLGEARSLLRVLSTRFHKVPKRISERISQIQDSIVLDSLTVTAVMCKSLKEFEEAL